MKICMVLRVSVFQKGALSRSLSRFVYVYIGMPPLPVTVGSRGLHGSPKNERLLVGTVGRGGASQIAMIRL